MAYEFETGSALASTIITILVTTLFIHFAAKFVLDRSSFLAALATAVLGTFLAEIVVGLLANAVEMPGWAVIAIGVAVWALVAAFFFRAKWVQGAIIGLVAWVLWVIVRFLIGLLF